MPADRKVRRTTSTKRICVRIGDSLQRLSDGVGVLLDDVVVDRLAHLELAEHVKAGTLVQLGEVLGDKVLHAHLILPSGDRKLKVSNVPDADAPSLHTVHAMPSLICLLIGNEVQ